VATAQEQLAEQAAALRALDDQVYKMPVALIRSDHCLKACFGPRPCFSFVPRTNDVARTNDVSLDP
jgi:hypothetical protein